MWPHADYPLIEVGRLTLDRNPTDYHTEIEQAAFEPSNLVPGIGPSPDKMLLGRMFSYADAHRARIGVNYKQLPVNAPRSPGAQLQQGRRDAATTTPSDPVYAPNSKGGPRADTDRYGEPAGWYADGDMVRAAYTLHAEDDDWGQAGTLVREVHGRRGTRPAGQQHRRPPARRRHRTGAAARLRVLAQRRQGARRRGSRRASAPGSPDRGVAQ